MFINVIKRQACGEDDGLGLYRHPREAGIQSLHTKSLAP